MSAPTDKTIELIKEYWLLIIGLLLALFFVWLFFFGPCEWMFWYKTGELPTRCINYYIK